MITYQQNRMENGFTTGFETVQSAPLTLSVSEGTLTLVQSKKIIDGAGEYQYVKENDVHSFPTFELDIISDPDFSVVYDVYLLQSTAPEVLAIHVDRTEIALGEIPFYNGPADLLHTLVSFEVPPSTTNLSSVDISVRLVELSEN